MPSHKNLGLTITLPEWYETRLLSSKTQVATLDSAEENSMLLRTTDEHTSSNQK